MRVLQHYLNGMRICAFLRSLGISRTAAKRVALVWESLINPIIYKGGYKCIK